MVPADRIVPVASSDHLAANRPHPTEYLRTEADHIQSWKADPDTYDAALSAFLDTLGGVTETLAGRPRYRAIAGAQRCQMTD